MRLIAAILVVLVAGLVGCSTAHAPKLAITGAAVTERTADGMVVTFTVEADNSNADPLPLRDVAYEVSLNGKPVFAGVRSAEATVRRYGTQTFTLPAAVPGGGDGTVPYTISGKIDYIVSGALAETLFDIHVLRPSTSFGGKGVVDLAVVKAPEKPTLNP